MTMDQALPFQCSARVWKAPLLLKELPTAQQSEVVMQATPERRLCCDAPGLGVVTLDQVSPLAPAGGLVARALTATTPARTTPAPPTRINRLSNLSTVSPFSRPAGVPEVSATPAYGPLTFGVEGSYPVGN